MLNKNLFITSDNIFNYQKMNYYNSKQSLEFNKLVININYLNELPRFNEQKYIVYHHRIKNDGTWDQSEETLNEILNYKEKYNIVIFSKKKYNIDDNKVYFTSNLKEYASFIHHNNCLAIISVWSGGAQLGSYCSNSNLIIYFDDMQLMSHPTIESDINKWIHSENAWDFCQFSGCNRFFIKKNEIANLKKYILN